MEALGAEGKLESDTCGISAGSGGTSSGGATADGGATAALRTGAAGLDEPWMNIATSPASATADAAITATVIRRPRRPAAMPPVVCQAELVAEAILAGAGGAPRSLSATTPATGSTKRVEASRPAWVAAARLVDAGGREISLRPAMTRTIRSVDTAERSGANGARATASWATSGKRRSGTFCRQRSTTSSSPTGISGCAGACAAEAGR